MTQCLLSKVKEAPKIFSFPNLVTWGWVLTIMLHSRGGLEGPIHRTSRWPLASQCPGHFKQWKEKLTGKKKGQSTPSQSQQPVAVHI